MNGITDERMLKLGAIIDRAMHIEHALRFWADGQHEETATERFGADGIETLVAAGYGPMVTLFDQMIARAQIYSDAMHAIALWEEETQLSLGEHPSRATIETLETECHHWLSMVQETLMAIVWPQSERRDEFQRVSGIYD